MKKWLATIPDGKLPNNQMKEGYFLLIYRFSVVGIATRSQIYGISVVGIATRPKINRVSLDGIATRPQGRWSEVQISVNLQTGSIIHWCP